MRKTYINPMTYVFQMQMQHHVLTGSGVTTNSDGDVESVGYGGDYDGNGFKSRRGGFWDDDDDDE